jgi:hypothetical protein
MKIQVVHDAEGNIQSVGVPAQELQGRLRLVAPSGLQVSEVDAPDITDDAIQTEQGAQRLHELVERYRLEVGQGQARLVRK